MENEQRSVDNSFILLKCNNSAKIRRTNSLNDQSGSDQLLLHGSILIHLRIFFLPLRPSVRLNYPITLPVSSYAVKLVHFALCSFLLTLRAETSRWKRIAFRPTVFPLTKVILMGCKRQQSARLFQSAISTKATKRDKSNRDENWKQTALHRSRIWKKRMNTRTTWNIQGILHPDDALWFRSIIKFSLSAFRYSHFTKTAKRTLAAK